MRAPGRQAGSSAAATKPGAARPVYAALDGLRGIAALLVVLYHAEFVMGFALVPNGYLAVDLFFAISGVVIAHAYDARLSAGLGTGRFAMMRILRFWPLYLLGLVLGLAAKLAQAAAGDPHAMAPWEMGASFLLNALFLPALFPTYGNVLFPLNPVSWSLFFELLVNILYACFLPLLSRRTVGWLALLSGAGFAVAAALHGTTNVGWSSTQIWLGLARAVFSFSAGIWIVRAGIRAPSLPFWLLAGLVALFLCVPVAPAARPWLTLGFILLASPAIVALGMTASVPAAMMRVTAWLGAISYALYAVHKPILSLARLVNAQVGAPGPVAAALCMALLCLLCGLLDRHYDGPARRWIGGRLGLARPRLRTA
ncbi:MAG: acyltransferase [Sphingobium sp.]